REAEVRADQRRDSLAADPTDGLSLPSALPLCDAALPRGGARARGNRARSLVGVLSQRYLGLRGSRYDAMRRRERLTAGGALATLTPTRAEGAESLLVRRPRAMHVFTGEEIYERFVVAGRRHCGADAFRRYSNRIRCLSRTSDHAYR